MDPNQEHGDSARHCAAQILRGFAKQKHEFFVSLTPKLRFGLFMRRIFPELYFRVMTKAEQE